jgi:hypothetical protein
MNLAASGYVFGIFLWVFVIVDLLLFLIMTRGVKSKIILVISNAVWYIVTLVFIFFKKPYSDMDIFKILVVLVVWVILSIIYRMFFIKMVRL